MSFTNLKYDLQLVGYTS